MNLACYYGTTTLQFEGAGAMLHDIYGTFETVKVVSKGWNDLVTLRCKSGTCNTRNLFGSGSVSKDISGKTFTVYAHDMDVNLQHYLVSDDKLPKFTTWEDWQYIFHFEDNKLVKTEQIHKYKFQGENI